MQEHPRLKVTNSAVAILLASVAPPGVLIDHRLITSGDEWELLPAEAASFTHTTVNVRRRSGSARIVARALLGRLGVHDFALVRAPAGGPPAGSLVRPGRGAARKAASPRPPQRPPTGPERGRGTPKIKSSATRSPISRWHSRRATSQNPGFEASLIAATASRDRRSSPVAARAPAERGRRELKTSASRNRRKRAWPASSHIRPWWQ